MNRPLAAFVAALALAGPAAAQTCPTVADLEDEVICPTCNTTLDMSRSPIADRMRAFIADRAAACDSKDEIKAALVAEFGEGVLAAPPKRGFNLLAWLLPLAGAAVAVVALTFAARRWLRSRPGAPAAVSEAPLDPELDRRVDEELARFEG